MTTITLPFEPMGLMFSAPVNKLYASGMEEVSGGPPVWRQYAVSLSAPSGPIERFDTSIEGLQQTLVINDKLRRGYALMMSGDIKVFSTDSDTLLSIAEKPSCSLDVLAINQATDMVYGGGDSDKGACLVQFNAAGHVVREKVFGSTVKNTSLMIGALAVDSASGDLLYLNASGLARVNTMLQEKWRTPVQGVGREGWSGCIGVEATANTAYVGVGAESIIAPTRVFVLDADTGIRRAEFSGPGSCQGFAATGDGQVFVMFANSTDLCVLSNGANSLTKFASFSDIPGWAPSDLRWLQVDPAGRRLFVSAGGHRQIAVYRY